MFIELVTGELVNLEDVSKIHTETTWVVFKKLDGDRILESWGTEAEASQRVDAIQAAADADGYLLTPEVVSNSYVTELDLTVDEEGSETIVFIVTEEITGGWGEPY